MDKLDVLLQKIAELNRLPNKEQIDIDLMLDHTRALYAALLEQKAQPAGGHLPDPSPAPLPSESMVAGIMSGVSRPEITAPPVELELTATNYTAPKDLAPEPQPRPAVQKDYPDIRRSIGINDKYQFISELFSNNKQAYEQVLDQINTFDTEDEAFEWLEAEVATQNNWRNDDEAVQYFYTTISDYFSNR